MAPDITNEYLPDVVSPPGATLQDILQERRISQTELADRIGRTKKMVNEIVKGKAPITPETALQLEKVLGVPASFWNEREMAYRVWLASREEQERLRQQIGWVREVPYAEMARLKWVPRTRNKVEQVRFLLRYFGVASSDQWKEVLIRPQAVYRCSTTLKTDSGALSAWLRQGELQAAQSESYPYNHGAFTDTLASIRRLTVQPAEDFVPLLIEKCARCGVSVVFVPELRGLPIWGATKWLSAHHAMILLTLRYKTDDHLWFTFFHETAHILLHNKKDVFIETASTSSQEEKEADRFAANYLIPPNRFQRFREAEQFSAEAVIKFARSLGIAPGIVVGRLQHDKLIPYSQLNQLKRRFRWSL